MSGFAAWSITDQRGRTEFTIKSSPAGPIDLVSWGPHVDAPRVPAGGSAVILPTAPLIIAWHGALLQLVPGCYAIAPGGAHIHGGTGVMIYTPQYVGLPQMGGPVEDALATEHNLQAPHVERAFDWDVNVLQSDQVNAFCLPGGKIAVYTGLVPVAQNADAMAIVLGHEISHALLRHGAQRMTEQKLAQIGQMAGAMSGMDQSQMQAVMAVYGYGRALPYARKQETQADEMGLMLAAAACYNPQEAIPLWERMTEASGGGGQPEFASTHPNPGTRIQNLQALMPKAMEYRAKFCTQSGTTAGAR